MNRETYIKRKYPLKAEENEGYLEGIDEGGKAVVLPSVIMEYRDYEYLVGVLYKYIEVVKDRGINNGDGLDF